MKKRHDDCVPVRATLDDGIGKYQDYRRNCIALETAEKECTSPDYGNSTRRLHHLLALECADRMSPTKFASAVAAARKTMQQPTEAIR